MKKIEVEIDRATAIKLDWLSKLYNCSPQELLIKAIQQMATSQIDKYLLLGGWENETELIGKMLNDITIDRGRSQEKEDEKSPA